MFGVRIVLSLFSFQFLGLSFVEGSLLTMSR